MYDNLITINDIDAKRSEKMKEKVRYVFNFHIFGGADLSCMIQKMFILEKSISEAQAGRPQTSKMESSATIVNGQMLLTIVTKRSIFYFCKSPTYASGRKSYKFLIDRFPISVISFWNFLRTFKKPT